MMTSNLLQKYSEAFATNQAFWDGVTAEHTNDPLYAMDAFKAGKTSLNTIELELLTQVKGKSVLHLQCHFGQDTISLKRMGADKAVGLDLSHESIKTARALAAELDQEVEFVQGNVYQTAELLEGRVFDHVFTSYGALVWLPDLDVWAEQVAAVTQSGSEVTIVEFHPLLYIFDFPTREVSYHYFNKKMYEEVESGSYASNDGVKRKQCFWQHSLEEVFNALKKQGFSLKVFKEYDYSPYHCFENMLKLEEGKYVFDINNIAIPHIYAMQWVKD